MEKTIRLIACLLAGAHAYGAGLTITHGPILGRLGVSEIGVWVRTDRPGSFHVRYGVAPARLDMMSPTVQTLLDRDNTGWVRITGLRPNTKYFYEAVTEGGSSGPGGSFRTLPDATGSRDPATNPRGLFNFSFEFACGNNQNPQTALGPSLPAYKTMLERLKDRVHFAILNGDWLYEEAREYRAGEWLKQAGISAGQMPRTVQLAPTIAGVWENYKLYLSRGKNLAAWHREVPSFFVLDDHEILNDVYGTATAGRRDRRSVFRDIGVQAWFDYLAWSNPVKFTQAGHFGRARLKAGSDVLTDPDAGFTALDLSQMANLHVHWGGPDAGVNVGKLDRAGGDPNAGNYDIVQVLDGNRLRVRPAAKQDGEPFYSIGRRTYYEMKIGNVHFFVLDTRSHRDMHDVTRPGQPGLSMIGAQQKKWLIDGMKASDADFFFVVSSVNFMIPHRAATGAQRASQQLPNKDDAWTVFLDEREQLIRYWDSLGQPVFVLTGDLHNSFAIRVTDRVWEFASGPHNSPNHSVAAEAGRPPNGEFDSMGRKCDIRWSSYLRDDVPPKLRSIPIYTVVQINNVFANASKERPDRLVAFPRPHVVFQYYSGFTGELLYAEPIHSGR